MRIANNNNSRISRKYPKYIYRKCFYCLLTHNTKSTVDKQFHVVYMNTNT